MCSAMNANLFVMPTIDKWDNVCRLCMEKKNEMLSIFGEEGLQRRVVQKLQACLPVLVYKTDPLPKQICQFCAARLDDAFEFREHCLNVYKTMHAILLKYQHVPPVRAFLNAMKTSQDPCQAQLCKDKSRAPPPLVPLSSNLPLDDPVAAINQDSPDQLQNACMETLSELPCEVEIKESAELILAMETVIGEPLNTKCMSSEMFNSDSGTKISTISISNMEEDKMEYQTTREEKRTSILEQVLTGNLTMTNRQKLQPRAKLTSEWWCAPCNRYYKTRDSLVRHMQSQCPRVYTCGKCFLSFESVELLAEHEAWSHLKVKLDFTGSWKDCDQCDRQFISWKMLRQHRLRDHLAEFAENNTRCALCNRSFPTLKAYQEHVQLHQTNCNSIVTEKLTSTESVFSVLKIMERSKEGKRGEQFHENVKSLTCPICGKVCTQQSALSNHMRTHEPKKFKCEICGRSFGLFIRLVAHRISEHNKQPTMSPILSAVEQEEALNAEREAREAREARTRGVKNKSYSEMMENDHLVEEESSANFSRQNVAMCGICLQYFSDHTTMLTHLQTHSNSYSVKSFACHVCKKSFKEQWQLLRHEACHKRLTLDNASLYTCTVCNKSFADNITYKAHQKTHTVDKTYHCAKCNKIFFKEVSLLAHQCTGEALFGKRAATEPLQRTSSHSSNKRHNKCSKGDAVLSSAQSRNPHTKIHTESMHGNAAQAQEIKIEADDEPMPKLRPETSLEYNVPLIEPEVEINEQSTPPVKRTLIRTSKGYRCGVCESPFVFRDIAVAHLKSAHPSIPYQCPYCKKRFSTQYTFTHHIKTQHRKEPEK
ncbi:hypothetical protein DMN91_009963 [Ooceraea biroi]|uniref:Zinc finger protein n=1 Tax=Ooceraea biroi TaxID=2015173 RepID=A0A026WXP8_OOCBI|nr:zinc finger protein 271 [Ooceraea biroi]EZA60516.1 hypothetical protein X777_14541 [Ooceraea biroi]RLU17726.1 hypothetical protein DMN91_009963 [Ooceraea biroi]